MTNVTISRKLRAIVAMLSHERGFLDRETLPESPPVTGLAAA
jgi:hypothetical protein